MLPIAWTDKVCNDQVLQRANTSSHLLKVIVSRQIRFVGHVMRKNQLEATKPGLVFVLCLSMFIIVFGVY